MVLAGSCFAAVVQLSPSRDLSTTHILALRCFALAIPLLIAFWLIGIRLHSRSDVLNLLWQFLYALGFAASLSGLTILFAASDSTSAAVFGATFCLLLLIWYLHHPPTT